MVPTNVKSSNMWLIKDIKVQHDICGGQKYFKTSQSGSKHGLIQLSWVRNDHKWLKKGNIVDEPSYPAIKCKCLFLNLCYSAPDGPNRLKLLFNEGK